MCRTGAGGSAFLKVGGQATKLRSSHRSLVRQPKQLANRRLAAFHCGSDPLETPCYTILRFDSSIRHCLAYVNGWRGMHTSSIMTTLKGSIETGYITSPALSVLRIVANPVYPFLRDSLRCRK